MRTSTDVNHIKAFIHQDRHLTIQMISDELNEYMAHRIVTQDLNIRKVCAKVVPKNLNDDQKAHQNEALAEMLQWPETPRFS
jgi:hypothetical protein